MLVVHASSYCPCPASGHKFSGRANKVRLLTIHPSKWCKKSQFSISNSDFHCQVRPRRRYASKNPLHFVRREFILLQNGLTWSRIAVSVTDILTICHSNPPHGFENREISENADIVGSIRPQKKESRVLQLILLQEFYVASACVKVFNSCLPALRVTNLSSTPSPSSFLLHLDHVFTLNFDIQCQFRPRSRHYRPKSLTSTI